MARKLAIAVIAHYRISLHFFLTHAPVLCLLLCPFYFALAPSLRLDVNLAHCTFACDRLPFFPPFLAQFQEGTISFPSVFIPEVWRSSYALLPLLRSDIALLFLADLSMFSLAAFPFIFSFSVLLISMAASYSRIWTRLQRRKAFCISCCDEL